MRGPRNQIVLGLVAVAVVIAAGVAAFVFVPERQPADAADAADASASGAASGAGAGAGAGVGAACTQTPSGGGAVALGDSITIGSTDDHAEDSWFEQLACAEDSPVRYGYNAGIRGETTAAMLTRLDAAVLARFPETVFVLGGTNDVLTGIPHAETIANLRALVERSRQTGADVYLGTIPPQEVPVAVESTEQLNVAITALAGQLDVPLLDFYAALVDTDGSYRDGLFADMVHPSVAGAQVMAQVARDALN